MAAGLFAVPVAAQAAEPYKLLVFTKDASVAATEGVAALQASAPADATLEVTDDASRFTPTGLQPYKAVVFLNNSGDILTDAQQTAFEDYFRASGGLLTIGSAIEAEPSWTFLTNVIGTRASGAATDAQQATIKVADRVHAASKTLPERWQRTDRWYNFTSNVRGQSHVLATVDQTTYTGGTMNTLADHPIAWCKDFRGGRSFYTGLGNTVGSFAEPDFRAHLKGAMQWVAGQADPVYSDCGATVLANYKQTKIAAPPNIGEPIGFDQLPDGRIIQTTRTGAIRLHNPTTGTTQVIGNIPVYTTNEDGLYGPAIDNDFATNKWVYFFYSPQQVTITRCDGTTATITTPTGAAPNTSTDPCVWQNNWAGYFQLSRFKFVDGATPSIDLASEQKILQVTNNRGACCHVAGDIDFDKNNNLWMVTGDDTPSGGGNSGGFGPFNDMLNNEAQTLRITNATGGTFTLTFNGQTTAPLPHNATAAQVQTALLALANVGAGNIAVTGGPINTANATVSFRGTFSQANVDQITADITGLTGDSAPALAVNTTAQGGTIYQAPHVDARRSSQNTADLRGKVLRIKVKSGDIAAGDENKADLGAGTGAYTIPSGNLYPLVAGAPQERTRPEVYAMGFRNPFRIQVDENDVAYIADYSPDASTPTNFRGPAGTGRIEIVRKPSNYGWPLCYSPDLPFYRWDFNVSAPLDAVPTTQECNNPERGPQNASRWVRDGGPTVAPGREYGPPVSAPDVWYSYQDNANPARGTPCLAYYNGSGTANCPQLFPELGTGQVGPHSATKYKYDPSNPSTKKLPPYYDGAVFFGEFSRNFLKEIRLDSDNKVLKINTLFGNCGAAPSTTNPECDGPMDMQIGADGAVYLLTYGGSFFNANADAGMYKWEYVKGQQAPNAVITTDRTDGQGPLTVNYSSANSNDPDVNDTLTFAWDFTNDGTVDSILPTASHTYTQRGVYTATLTVTDGAGNKDIKSTVITVGNTSPKIKIEVPTDGGFFAWGNHIPYRVVVTDPEDGPIDCSKVKTTFVLVHDTHGHGGDERLGCSGYLNTLEEDASHGGYIAGGISVEYTDKGSEGIPALTTVEQHVLQIRRQQVEYAQEQSGTTVAAVPAAEPDPTGGQIRGSLDAGDWIAIPRKVNLGSMDKQITFRYAGGATANPAGNPRAAVEIRLGSPTGPIAQTVVLRSTGTNNNTYTSQTFPLEFEGSHQLFFVFRTTTGTGAPTSGFGNLNWIEFSGRGNDLPTDTAPITTHSITPSNLACEGTCTSITGASKITLAGTDDVEVAKTEYRIGDGAWTTYSAPFALDLPYGLHTLEYRSTDVDGNVEESRSVRLLFNPSTTGPVGGTVGATLALTLGASASFPPFTPGVEQEYTASTAATVVSTAGDATLTVSDSGPNPGHLVNGAFSLPQPLQGLGVVKTWTGPTSNEVVPVVFKQKIGRTDALRTGTYSKTLTFTLSTTTP